MVTSRGSIFKKHILWFLPTYLIEVYLFVLIGENSSSALSVRDFYKGVSELLGPITITGFVMLMFTCGLVLLALRFKVVLWGLLILFIAVSVYLAVLAYQVVRPMCVPSNAGEDLCGVGEGFVLWFLTLSWVLIISYLLTLISLKKKWFLVFVTAVVLYVLEIGSFILIAKPLLERSVP